MSPCHHRLLRCFQELFPSIHSILSVRELRTLLSRITDLPLGLEAVNNFESLLRECDKHYNGTRPSVDPIEFETHYDPDLVRVAGRKWVWCSQRCYLCD